MQNGGGLLFLSVGRFFNRRWDKFRAKPCSPNYRRLFSLQVMTFKNGLIFSALTEVSRYAVIMIGVKLFFSGFGGYSMLIQGEGNCNMFLPMGRLIGGIL